MKKFIICFWCEEENGEFYWGSAETEEQAEAVWDECYKWHSICRILDVEKAKEKGVQNLPLWVR